MDRWRDGVIGVESCFLKSRVDTPQLCVDLRSSLMTFLLQFHDIRATGRR